MAAEAVNMATCQMPAAALPGPVMRENCGHWPGAGPGVMHRGFRLSSGEPSPGTQAQMLHINNSIDKIEPIINECLPLLDNAIEIIGERPRCRLLAEQAVYSSLASFNFSC